MSNYYSKRDAKVNIAHYLMENGWEVFGYYADNSDSMTDYYDPASWRGIAIKNGFVLVVDNSTGAEEQEIKKYNHNSTSYNDMQKIAKLEEMTQERGCTPDEEASAKQLIENLKSKKADTPEYEVVGITPAYMGNPGKCIWHIEKNGKIYDKGNSLTKFSDLPKEWMFDYEKMEYKDSYRYTTEWNYETNSHERVGRKPSEDMIKLITEFKNLMNRIEKVSNSEVKVTDGSEEGKQAAEQQEENQGYEKIIKTEYKTEIKSVEVETPEQITDTMYFMLKVNFNHGCYKGNIYKINSVDENPYNNKYYVDANKMNGKLNKVLTGRATTANNFHVELEKLEKWIEKDSIVIVELQEVQVAYDVEKWVKINDTKKTYNSTPKENKEQETQETASTSELNMNNYDYTITEDTDTRDDSQIWVLKLNKRVSKEEFNKIRYEIMKPIKGYYSSYKGGFIFTYDPSNVLNDNSATEPEQEQTQEPERNENEHNTEPEMEQDTQTEQTEAEHTNNKEEYTEQKETHNSNSNFNFDDILNKFDNIEIKQIDKITAEDREYCEIQEKLYMLAHTAYTDILQKLKKTYETQNKEFDNLKEKYNMQDYSRNHFGYVSDYGDCGIHEIETTIVKITGSFISRITYYFKNKYMVELNSEYKEYNGFNHYHDSPSKLNAITLDTVLEDYIFSQLDGYSFVEKAIQQIKEKSKTPLYWYDYRKYWNYEIKGKTIKFKCNIDNIKAALYYYDSNETKIINSYSFQKVDTFKYYENGNTDIKFYNAEFALEFATKYLGYIEMTEEQREEYKKKCRY